MKIFETKKRKIVEFIDRKLTLLRRGSTQMAMTMMILPRTVTRVKAAKPISWAIIDSVFYSFLLIFEMKHLNGSKASALRGLILRKERTTEENRKTAQSLTASTLSAFWIHMCSEKSWRKRLHPQSSTLKKQKNKDYMHTNLIKRIHTFSLRNIWTTCYFLDLSPWYFNRISRSNKYRLAFFCAEKKKNNIAN